MANAWNSELYDQAHSFVWKFGADLLPLLNPKPGEHIVDLGCGTGHLTAEIARTGARVTGIDSSAEMITQAKALYPALAFRRGDARNFTIDEPADAVFSNAALHWVTDAEAAVRSIAGALKPGGRFVAEFGGKGNITQLLAGTIDVLRRHGIQARNPWYFPSIAEYATLLERHGLEVRRASLFDRITQLEEGENAMRDWLKMFGAPLLDGIPESERAAFAGEIATRLEPVLRREGRWYADYRRIRVVAVRLD